MAVQSLNQIATQLRRTVLRSDGASSDGQLLGQFIHQRDEAAFEALVKRHGPMVLGVCQRVLGNCHDADDAFQATFLILVHKAAALRSCDLVGNWLYGVAYNTALAARAKNQRRRRKEMQVIDMPEPAATPPEDWSELRPVLDQELNRLSGVYREALVLCALEGKTRKEAAQLLGIPEGTMSSRLTTARRQLEKRLARHGLTLSAGAFAALLAASVPAPLAASTVKAATAGTVSASVLALTEGVLKAMFMTKVKSVTAVALALLLTVGLFVVGYSMAAPVGKVEENKEQPAPRQVEKKDGDPELAALQGTWTVDIQGWAGKDLPKEIMKGYKFVFAGNKLTWDAAIGMTKAAGKIYPADGAFPCDFKIDASKKPKEIDITLHTKQGDRTLLGIYEITGDTLKVCYFGSKADKRPANFAAMNDPGVGYFTLTRAKKLDNVQGNAKNKEADNKKDLAALKGTWNIDSQGWAGKSLPKELLENYKFVIEGNKLTWNAAIGMMSKGGKISALGGAYPGEFKIDASKKPKEIDITLHVNQREATFLGIYEINGDTLKLRYYSRGNGKRPIDFDPDDTTPGIGFITLSRAKKADK